MKTMHQIRVNSGKSAILFSFAVSIAASLAATGQDLSAEVAKKLNGAQGKAYKVDAKTRHFELLTKTAYDPKTNEGRSRFPVYWSEKTKFTRVVRQNDFSGLPSPVYVHFSNIKKPSGGKGVVNPGGKVFGRDVGINLDEQKDGLPEKFDPKRMNLSSYLFIDAKNPKKAAVMFQGKKIPLSRNGMVTIKKRATELGLVSGLTAVRVWGGLKAGRFVTTRIDLTPIPDPRKTDDPNLPRVLVVGDSISMNYHNYAKQFLKGKANYYRVEGNGGPSSRGLATMDLWLGNYTEPGLQWDVIQFNHGLHDLKEEWDPKLKTWTHRQVPVEQYKKNLGKGIAMMKKTGAKLIWATTTPVPKGGKGSTYGRRNKGDSVIYNKAAAEVMARHPEIVVNDLYTLTQTDPTFTEWRTGSHGVHFGPEGSKALGKQVAEVIEKVLNKKNQ